MLQRRLKVWAALRHRDQPQREVELVPLEISVLLHIADGPDCLEGVLRLARLFQECDGRPSEYLALAGLVGFFPQLPVCRFLLRTQIDLRMRR